MFYIFCLNNENLFGFTVLRTNEKDVKIINLSQGDHLSVSFLALPRPSRRWILDLWRLTELSRKINWNTHLTNAFENHQHQHMTFKCFSAKKIPPSWAFVILLAKLPEPGIWPPANYHFCFRACAPLLFATIKSEDAVQSSLKINLIRVMSLSGSLLPPK